MIFCTRSLWDVAPRFVDAISSVFQDAGTSAAIGNIGGDVIEGGAAGAGVAALKGGNPLTGALIGGVGGGALGVYNNYSALTTGATPNALLDSNGNAITPPIPPSLDANGNPVSSLSVDPNTGQLTDSASSTGGTYDTAGNLVSGSGAGSTASQAASNATGMGNSVTKGVPGGINNTSLELGALAALGSALNKPAVGTWSTPSPSSVVQGSTYNTPLNSNYSGRTAVNPGLPTGTQPNYWSYGGPEQTYFQNNSIASFGYARGGALAPRGEWTVERNGHHVRGPGTGTSDQVPAMLSNKEYVLTYDDLARLGMLYGRGQGDPNEKGARVLDKFRKKLAEKTDQPQFPSKKLGAALNERAPK